MSLQQSHENLEFLKGAVWCAAKLVQEIGDSKGAAILITNPETERRFHPCFLTGFVTYVCQYV